MKNCCVAVSALLLVSLASYMGTKIVSAEPIKTEQHANIETASALFERAYASYIEGKQAYRADIRSEAYAEAIRAISQAASVAPESTDVLLLASQIYRAKGGIAYAKGYFSRAESLLLLRLAATSKDIGTNLDYAIACCAGDVRFTENRDAYKKIADRHANEIIRMVKDKKQNASAADWRAMAFAYLVRGDDDSCGRILAERAAADATARFYSELFTDTVAQGKWLWPVSADGARYEFLLYVLFDVAHGAGV